jgi:methionyl-tRNA formyltransferase
VAYPSKALRLAFAGTPQFAVPALEALCATRHEVCAVFTQADRGAGRGRILQPSAVKQRAAALGLTVHQPVTFRSPEARSLLASLGVDAFVVVAYGLILPLDVLEIPPLGCLNIHASLLPRWRGAAPVQRAILAGDATTGVTIMRMEPGVDTGPILAAHAVEIAPQDTAQSLADRLSILGAQLIAVTLDRLAAGPVEAVPQAASGVCYAAKIDKSAALIDWHQEAAAIARKVRAFNPRPVAETRCLGQQLRIWEAEVAPTSLALPAAAPAAATPPGTVLGVSAAGIDVACGQGALRVTRVQSPGRKIVSAAQFANQASLAGTRFPYR